MMPNRELSWFPYVLETWAARVQGLTDTEEGALMRACRRSWLDVDAPCTIHDSDGAFARILGAGWEEGAATIRAHFTEPVADGRLRCPWLWAMYEAQRAKVDARRHMGAPRARGAR